MKIDLVTPFFYPVWGGEEKHEFHIAKELQKLKHEITIHTSNIDRHNKKLKSQEIIQGIKVKRYNVLFKLGEFSSFFPSVIRSLRNSDSDLIHIHGYRHPHNLIAFLTKKQCIITPHWPNYPKGLRSKLNDFLIPIIDKTIGKIILKKCKLIFALNEGEKKWLISKFKIDENKIKIIPNGIPKKDLRQINKDIFRDRYKIPKNRILVLCVGRLHRSKGFDQVIKIAKYFPDIQFVILGIKDTYQKQLEKLVKGNKNIKILLNKSDKEKYQAYAAADIFICPSHYEGFGITVLEAFSQKCAVITSNNGGLPYTLGNAGLIFQDNNLNDLKNKLFLLIKNKNLRNKLQEQGYERVKNFTWEKIAIKIEKCYQEALKAK